MTERPDTGDDDAPDQVGDVDDADLSAPERRPLIDPAVFDALAPVRSLQRQIAGIDFSAIREAQRMIDSIPRAEIDRILETQRAVSESIATSIDFSAIEAANVIVRENSALLRIHADLQQTWTDSVLKAIDLSAFDQAKSALLRDAQLARFGESQQALANALAKHLDFTDRPSRWVTTLNFDRLLEQIDRWLPPNLRGVDDVDAIARVTLEDGIPLSWVPRTSIAQALVGATTPQERDAILEEHHGDILEDCTTALAELPDEWAHQCDRAVDALRAGFEEPAQSHAANIIDSIVLRLLGDKARDKAKTRALADIDDLPLLVASESLVLRPLYKAFTTWWPASGDPPPSHFARHATAHAIGHAGLFVRRHALVAVMLATSLTLQFHDDPATQESLRSAASG